MFDNPQVVPNSAWDNWLLSRWSLCHSLCSDNRVCWTKTSEFSWDIGVDVLHKFSNATEWNCIWNTGLENSVYCNICASVSFGVVLVVSEFQYIDSFSSLPGYCSNG